MSVDLGYAIAQGVAGAAASGVTTIDQQLKEEADNRAANRDLDIKQRLAAAQQQLQFQADDRKRALAVQQGQAVTTGATGLLNSAAASNINSSLGSAIDPNDPDSAASLAAIRSNPAAMKAYGLSPEDDLTKAKARSDAARNLGDLAAAGEEDKNVRSLVVDKRNEATDAATNRRLDQQEKFQEQQSTRQQTLAEATLKHYQVMESNSDSRAKEQAAREARSATAAALVGVSQQLKDLETEAKDMTIEPARKADIQKQLTSLRTEAATYRQALAGVGVQGGASAPSSLPPPKVGDIVQGLTFSGGDPRDKNNWKPAAATSASASSSAASATKGGLLSTAVANEGDLSKATPAQLWAAVSSDDPLQKQYATAELRRRGLLAPEPDAAAAIPANRASYFDAGQ